MLRHFGCPCCWELASALKESKERFDSAGVKLIVAGVGSPDKTRLLAERRYWRDRVMEGLNIFMASPFGLSDLRRENEDDMDFDEEREDVECEEEEDVEIKVIEKPTGKSFVWLHFKKIRKKTFGKEDGEKVLIHTSERAECLHCGSSLAYGGHSSGTSTLIRHIHNVCKKYEGRLQMQGEQPGSRNLSRKKWTQQGCREAAIRMMVIDELPFSFIEKEGFRSFCRYVLLDWEVPSRHVLMKQFVSMYNEEKLKLKSEMKGHCLSLTIDTWMSVQNINYMVVTAHFVDSGWKMQKRITSFKEIPNHQGTSIGKLLEDCLHEWEVKRVLRISVDNATANKVAVNYMREMMMLKWVRKPILDGKFLHVRFLAHILNIIVRSGMEMMGNSIASIRNVVRYIRSGKRLATFKKCMEKERIVSKKVCILDVPTRWNSTYLMLSTALELREAFDHLSEDEAEKYERYFQEEEELDLDLDEGFDIGATSKKNKKKKRQEDHRFNMIGKRSLYL